MTYLLSTCRKATAVLGSVYGNFDGSGEFHHLVLNCVTRLEVWEASVAEVERCGQSHNRRVAHSHGGKLQGNVSGGPFAYSPHNNPPPIGNNHHQDPEGTLSSSSSSSSSSSPLAPPPMRLVAELPMNGTIKHLLAVPLPASRAARCPRLCLFLTTEKQDVCIIALNRNKINNAATASAAGATSLPPLSEIVPETLYSTNIASSLFHRHFGQASICVSSHPDLGVAAATGNSSSASITIISNNGNNNNNNSNTLNSSSFAASAASSSSGPTIIDEDVSPIVALSHIRSYIILFDIAACIVEGAAIACSRRRLTAAKGEGGAKADAAANSKKRGRNGQQQLQQLQQQQLQTRRALVGGSGNNNSNGNNNDSDDDVTTFDGASVSTAPPHAALPAALPLPSDTTRDAATATNAGGGGGGGEDGVTATTTTAADEPTDAEVSQQLQSTRLFSMAFIGSALLRKRASLPFSYCPIMEPEPRSICLQRSTAHGRALLVLYQDPVGRTHVRRYAVIEQPANACGAAVPPPPHHNASSSAAAGTTSASASGQQHGAGGASASASSLSSVNHTMLQYRRTPLLAHVFDRSVVRLATKAHGLVLTRGATLQSDVETDAMLLHPMPRGVLIVGSILATYIDTEGARGPFGGRGHVTTVITPNPYARSEPVAAVNISPISCLVGYINGTVTVCALDDGERGELACYALATDTTPMTGLTALGGGFLFAPSAYHHSMLMHRHSGHCSIAVHNTGPIIEMAAIEPGNALPSAAAAPLARSIAAAVPSSSLSPSGGRGGGDFSGGGGGGGMAVVAATGVEHFSALQVIREAVQLTEDASVEGLAGVLGLYAVPAIAAQPAVYEHPHSHSHHHGGGGASSPAFGLLALSFANETRVMLFTCEDGGQGQGQALLMEEADYACSEPTLCLGRVAPNAVVHVTPSRAALLHLTPDSVRPAAGAGGSVAFPRPASLAVCDPPCSTLLVASGCDVGIYELPSLQLLHTVAFPHQVAAMDMTASYEVVVGLWDSNAIYAFSAEDMTPFAVVDSLPMLPRSLKLAELLKTRYMSDASASASTSALSSSASASAAPSAATTYTERHIFIGFPDGSVGLLPVDLAATSRRVGPLEHLALGSEPVTVTPITSADGRSTTGILCSGDVPGVLFASQSRGIDSAGFGVRPADSAAQLTPSTFATYVGREARLVISSLSAKISHRVNAIATPVRKTIPKMRLVPKWNNIILAAERDLHQDTIASYYVAGGIVNKSTRVTAPMALLESERCEFLEWLELNGAPFVVGEGEVPLTTATSTNPFTTNSNNGNNNNDNNTNSPFLAKGVWDAAAPFAAALIGTNFAYPNDDIPRNGRIILAGMERASTNNKMSFVQLCERDIRGMVMCATMVPRTNNRILVGVTGCVQMYRWSPTDRSFIYEVSASFGAAVTKLIPLSGSSLGAMKARPQPPQIVAATPATRPPTRPGSQTSQRTIGGFSSVSSLAAGGGGPSVAADDVFEEKETSSLVLCADIRNSLAIIALNPVELMRFEANERCFREVLDVVPAGNRPFIERSTGLRVYDPHFITSDTNLNLFIISAMKERRPEREGGSVYQLKGAVPQLSVCGQFHVGDRVTVMQRGTMRVARKIKSQFSVAGGGTSLQQPVVGAEGSSEGSGGAGAATSEGKAAASSSEAALDYASAAAAAAGAALGKLALVQRGAANKYESALLPDLSERFAFPTRSEGEGGPSAAAGALVASGVRDVSLPSFVYGTVHGAIGAITPLNPLAFNYLVTLQRCLAKTIRPVGGLSYDQFRKVFNRETSVTMSSTPHFVEPRDGDDGDGHRTAKLKAYNFVDGDLLFQFLAPTRASAGHGIDEPSRRIAVHMANKALRAAVFSGELFRGTDVDAKRLGLGGAAASATPTPTSAGPAVPSIPAAASRSSTPTVVTTAAFSAAQTQAPNSIPSTPASITPQQAAGGQQAPPRLITDANGNAFDENGNKVDTAALASSAADKKRTTFTPAELENLNAIFATAELPQFPLTVDACERFLSDLQRYC